MENFNINQEQLPYKATMATTPEQSNSANIKEGTISKALVDLDLNAEETRNSIGSETKVPSDTKENGKFYAS